MEEYKSVKKLLQKEKPKRNNYFLTKVLFLVILFLICLICYKESDDFRKFMDEKVFGSHLEFASFKKFYNDSVGKVIPFTLEKENTEMVFNEKLVYSNIENYLDGFKLEVGNKYLVPILESGIVVYIGEKEGYGNTIIVQQVDGVDTWYSNVNISNISLYDYVTKGTFLGESRDSSIYLTFQKDGVFLDYKEII